MADGKAEKTGLPIRGLRQGPGWKALQDALAKLVHCNVTILDPQGKRILEPSRHTFFCMDQLARGVPPVPPGEPDCIFQSFESCMLSNVALHTCRHKIDFSTLKLRFHDRVVAVVILGPFLTGDRRFLELDAFAQEPDPKDFAMGPDRIHDLKVFSSEKLAEIQNFVQCLFNALIVLSCVHVSATDSPDK